MINTAEISESLLADRSKTNVNRLILKMEEIGFNFHEFKEELEQQTQPAKWYMTWLLTHFVERNPSVGNEIQKEIWRMIKKTSHEGILRDLWRSLTFIEIDEDISGEVYDLASNTFTSQKTAIAVRAHSLETAAKIAKPYPELRSEMVMILLGLIDDESAAIRSKAKNWIKRLKN